MEHARTRPWGTNRSGGLPHILESIRWAYAQFLLVPTLVIAAFLLLVPTAYVLDQVQVQHIAYLRWLAAIQAVLRTHIFTSSQATSSLLGTVATGVITVTSITFSMLLLAVQQSASSLSSQVFQQYLRRTQNQFYLGYFVGLAIYTLLLLSTVSPHFNPVTGASLVLLLTVVALVMLVVLLYSAIEQMRPTNVIAAIHEHTLAARQRELHLITATRRRSELSGPVCLPVRFQESGYLVRLDLHPIVACAQHASGRVEVVMHSALGSFVAFDQEIAEVRAEADADAKAMRHATRQAVKLAKTADIDWDPSTGIREIATIGWSSISTARANAVLGLVAIDALSDLLARWTASEQHHMSSASVGRKHNRVEVPVVYRDDVLEHLLDALSVLAIPSSASRQPWIVEAVMGTFVRMFGRFTPDLRQRAEADILRMLSTLGDQVLTAELDNAMCRLVHVLREFHSDSVADGVQRARDQLAKSLGQVNGRSTRAG